MSTPTHPRRTGVWLSALVVMAFLLLAAHFLRLRELGLMASAVGFAALACSRRAWVRPVLFTALAVACLAWTETAVSFVRFRMAFGMPWARLAVIMGGVLAFTAACALLMTSSIGARRHDLARERSAPQAAAFVLTFAALLGLTKLPAVTLLLADRFLPGSGAFEAFLLALYAAWLTGRVLDPAEHARLRPRFWLLFSSVFFGQLALGLLGVPHMLMTGALHLPVPALIVAAPLYRGHGFFMLGMFLTTVALVGPAWCSHLCYVGSWDDRLSRMAPKSLPMPARLWPIRLAIAALVAASAFDLRVLGAPPLTAVLAAAASGLVGVGVMLAVSRRRGRMVHCTFFCPIGILANILGRLNPTRMRIDHGCDRCGRCSRVCRYGALSPLDLERGRPGLTCTLCGDCASACRSGRIGYRFPGLTPAAARAMFLVIVCSLHAIFLGVARM